MVPIFLEVVVPSFSVFVVLFLILLAFVAMPYFSNQLFVPLVVV